MALQNAFQALLTRSYSPSLRNKSHTSKTTDFVRFIQNTPIPGNAIIGTLDVCSLYTNIPLEEGIKAVCKYYNDHYQPNPPILTSILRDLMKLILKENSFHFNGKHFLQTHGIAMGKKWQKPSRSSSWPMKRSNYSFLALTNLSSGKGSLTTFSQHGLQSKQEIDSFVDFANRFHATIKFTCEMSSERAAFLDTKVFKGLRLLRTKSIKEKFESSKRGFKFRLLERGYPQKLVNKIQAEVDFSSRNSTFKYKPKTSKNILPFVTTYNPGVPKLKEILMKNWSLITNNANLAPMFPNVPIVAYKKDKSLKDLLVRAKIPPQP